MKKGLVTTLIITGVAVIAAAAFTSTRRAERRGTPVHAEAIERDDLVQIVSGTGRVRPVSEVSISANVSGRIVGLAVRSGDSVAAGQWLVRLDPTRYQAALAQAQAALASAETQVELARANLRQAEAEYRRVSELSRRGLVATADLESAHATHDVRAATLEASRNDVRRARASVDQASDDLAKTTIESPLTGTVTELRKEQGEIALGADFQEDVLLVVADLDRMEVRFEVDENDIVNVSLDDSVGVEVDAFPDTVFPGRVREIATSASSRGAGTQESATVFEVRADLSAREPGLRPGMSATVDVYSERRDAALAVPIQAITARSAETLARWEEPPADESEREGEEDLEELIEIAFVVEEGVARARRVETGISGDTHLEILGGLEEGEQVITGPYRTLSRTLDDGERVRVDDSEQDQEQEQDDDR